MGSILIQTYMSIFSDFDFFSFGSSAMDSSLRRFLGSPTDWFDGMFGMSPTRKSTSLGVSAPNSRKAKIGRFVEND